MPGLTLTLGLGARSVVGVLPIPTAAYDEFSDGAGQLPARSLSGTSATWTLERATDTSATHDTSMTVTTTGDGTAGGNGVAGAGNTYGVATAPGQNVVVLRKRPSAFNLAGHVVDHVTAAGDVVANLARLSFNSLSVVSAGVSSGRLVIGAEAPGGALVTIRQINAIRFEDGDIEAHEYTASGATLQVLQNGRPRDPVIDTSFATTGVPLSQKHGLNGASPTTNFDYFAIIDPATDAAIMLEQCPRIASLHPDGTATILLSGRYSIRAPSTLSYTLFDRSSGSRVAVTGHTDASLAVTTTAIDGTGWGTFSGSITLTEPQATALIGDPLAIRAWRTDVKDEADAATIFPAWTQVFRLGVVALGDGQSLGTHAWVQTVSGTATPATGSQWIDGNRTITITSRAMLTTSANTLPAHMSERFATLAGLPMSLARCGESSTSTTDRLPGTAIHDATLDAIRHGGGRVDIICDASGQNDASTPSTYYANNITIWDSYAAASRGGVAPLVVLAQMNKSWTNPDAAYQALREAQARLFEDGAAAVLGPNALDLRNEDTLHLGQASSDPKGSIAKWMQRWGQCIAFARGETAHDGQGPELFAAVRTNDTTITAYFDDDGYFDSFAKVGAAFHGGCRFSASTDASSPLSPTACSVGARVSGGLYDGMWPVTFTFGATLAATVYVWAGWGANPHNPTQDATINSTTWDDPATGASILQATKTGAPSGLDLVGIRPRLRFATPSYVVAV